MTPRATGGPVSADKAYLVGERGPELFMSGAAGRIVSGTRLRSFVRDQLWPILGKWLPGPMPRVGIGSMNSATRGGTAKLLGYEANWLFGGKPDLRNGALHALIHEMAHTAQSSKTWQARSSHDLSSSGMLWRWVREGGAEAFANNRTRRVMAALGWEGMDPSSRGFGTWYSKAAHAAWADRGREWILRKQFSYDRGGYLRPGWNLAYNGTGRPEPVGGGGNVYVFPNYVGDKRELVAAIQEADKAHRRQNGGRPIFA